MKGNPGVSISGYASQQKKNPASGEGAVYWIKTSPDAAGSGGGRARASVTATGPGTWSAHRSALG